VGEGEPRSVLRVVSDRAPTWSPKFVDAMVRQVYGRCLSFAWLVKTDVNHPMRLAIDTFLLEFRQGLRTDPVTMERAEQVQAPRCSSTPRCRYIIGATWTTAKRMLLDAGRGPVQRAAHPGPRGLVSLGTRLVETRSCGRRWTAGGGCGR